jgi:epoxyqueuosine reductase QueG
MRNINLPHSAQVTPVTNCGHCHECTEPLIQAGEDGDEEWCPRCCREKHYRSHGFPGMGDEAEFCPWVDIHFENQGSEIVTARGSRSSGRVLYEHHQPQLFPKS